MVGEHQITSARCCSNCRGSKVKACRAHRRSEVSPCYPRFGISGQSGRARRALDGFEGFTLFTAVASGRIKSLIRKPARGCHHFREGPSPDSCTAEVRRYSITSSALASTDAGRSRPSDLAVFRLTTSSHFGRRLHRQISRLRSGLYQRNPGPCRSGPNVSVLLVQSSDEVAGRSSPGPRPRSKRTPNARAA